MTETERRTMDCEACVDSIIDRIYALSSEPVSAGALRAALELAYTTGRRDEVSAQVVRLERKVAE
jgi:hypothetical protein